MCDINRDICQEKWLTPDRNFYYTLALLALQFVIPLAVLIFTYTRIAIAVWGKRPPGEAENSRDQRMARSKRKVSHHFHKILMLNYCCGTMGFCFFDSFRCFRVSFLVRGSGFGILCLK